MHASHVAVHVCIPRRTTTRNFHLNETNFSRGTRNVVPADMMSMPPRPRRIRISSPIGVAGSHHHQRVGIAQCKAASTSACSSFRFPYTKYSLFNLWQQATCGVNTGEVVNIDDVLARFVFPPSLLSIFLSFSDAQS